MATTSIVVEETPLVRQLLCRADDALILGHRLSEWTGHAPTLEEELALANIALDLIGQARALYSYAGTLTGHTEDQLAYLRDVPAWRNCLIVELPNGDFAFSIARLLLVSAFVDPFWRAAIASTDSTIAAIAAKAEKETAYHLRHAAEWLIRLGDGTAESHRRAQTALDDLWPYTGELFTAVCERYAARRRIRCRCATPGTPPSTAFLRAPRWCGRTTAGCSQAGATGAIPNTSATCWRICNSSSAPIRAPHGRPPPRCANVRLPRWKRSPIRRSRC